ncbi:hypothetical protein [Streptomyces sp. NPDC059786]|uniref:hypothetical protein n=1 Tax=Streptomyces sp. NPDC059786 TaxID=3346946 RepID=UPI0036621428
MLNILDAVISAGNTSRPNEDRYGCSGDWAWVIDGATDLEPDAFMSAPSDVVWLVDHMGELLQEEGAKDRGPGAGDLLHALARRVGDDMRALGFPADRIHPTCSVGLLRAGPDGIELARVGDPTCLAFGRRTIEVSTTFFGRREAQAIERASGADLTDTDSRDGIRRRRQMYIRGAFEESVFSGHPDAVLHIQTETLGPGQADYVLLCTDGFARAVVDYHIYPDWRALLQEALESGLSAVLDRVRNHETKALSSAHFKKSDDATALLIRV